MYDLETIVRCVLSPFALTRCHSDYFRPHTTHFDLFMLFSMIACLYQTDCYIDRLDMYSPVHLQSTWSPHGVHSTWTGPHGVLREDRDSSWVESRWSLGGVLVESKR